MRQWKTIPANFQDKISEIHFNRVKEWAGPKAIDSVEPTKV